MVAVNPKQKTTHPFLFVEARALHLTSHEQDCVEIVKKAHLIITK